MKHKNNFDLIRLLAALQVAFHHSIWHLDVSSKFFLNLDKTLAFFPGVPIFFFISGYLVHQSWERTQNSPVRYIKNRALRIFPALIAVAIVGLVLLTIANPNVIINNLHKTGLWFLGQISLVQFYTPQHLRFWGVGTPNGSLWTLSVELQFYIVLPFVSILLRKKKPLFLIILLALSVLANYLSAPIYSSDSLLGKILGVSLSSYLFFFLLGITMNMYREKVLELVKTYYLIILGLFIGLVVISMYNEHWSIGGYWLVSFKNVVYYALLCMIVIGFAYKKSFFPFTRVLNGFDISYGVYIYHMLVLNLFVNSGLTGKSKYLIMALTLSICCGILSWLLVERVWLKRKTVPNCSQNRPEVKV